MKKTILIGLSIMFLACSTDQVDTANTSHETENEMTVASTEATQTVEMNNYAVVWKWTTNKNKSIIEGHANDFSNELLAMWKENSIENVYFDTKNTEDQFDKFPGISYFMRAKNESDAKNMLDKLTIVKLGVAENTLHPVGLKWLKREHFNRVDGQAAYVVIWSSTEGIEFDEDVILEQNNYVLELYEKGIIENVYFDIDGIEKKNEASDFVFFINADSKEKAEDICNTLPFNKKGYATYELHSVGQFWLGTFENEE